MTTRVLVVDDSEMVRNLHSFMLRGGGFEVRQASNGSEALEVLLTERFDVIVSDVNMPKMDGLELTRRIRTTAGYQDTPVILVSTEAEAQDRVNGLRAGANVYVVKPARAPDLLLNVRMLLGR
ncbi:response regulator [Gemmata sp. G18]|uniref:Response regulator n=1 Tax=Gemmata palustris TaxID=2822762 RepID=A0ABS5BSL7_9BACT|nr:response regulator [Gemmata palustris]MBP3956725.1 response regulator [Gemmata palustris]